MNSWAEILAGALSNPGRISSAYSAFHSYSLGNQVAAMVQLLGRGMPISPIASYKAWQEKGRQVKKGEKALALCMPITCKGERKSDLGEVEEYTFSRFSWKNNWFSLDQTEGKDFSAPVVALEWDKQIALAALEITEAPFSSINGNIQGYAFGRSIAISPLAALPQKTTFHEMAHIVLGHTAEATMQDGERTPRDIRELEAEGVAFVLCSLLLAPGVEEARGYMQAWFSGPEIPEKSAQRIFGAADKIFKAGKPA